MSLTERVTADLRISQASAESIADRLGQPIHRVKSVLENLTREEVTERVTVQARNNRGITVYRLANEIPEYKPIPKPNK